MNMKGKLFIAACLWFAVAVSLQAQIRISGSVLDESGAAVPGAGVTVEGMKNAGAVTALDGSYSFELPQNGQKQLTLLATAIGYETQRRRIKEPEGSYVENFTLAESQELLETVVVTATRTPKLLKDVPIITRVISAEEIERADVVHIGELLETELPGLEFSYSMNQQVSLNMQGFGGNSVLFLVDGERLAGETLDNIDYNRLNLDNVARVEIVKGAASSLYGSNAIGGVVNIITKEPSEPWSVNVNTRYSTLGEKVGSLSAGFRAGKLSGLTNAQYVQSDSIPLKNDGDYSKIYGSWNYNIKQQLVYRPFDRLKLTGKAGYYFRQRDASEDVKDNYRDFSGSLKAEYDFGESDNLTLSYTFDQYDKSDFLVANRRDVREYSNVQHNVRALWSHSFGENDNIVFGGDFMRDYLLSYQFEDGDKMQYTGDLFGQLDWNPTERLNFVSGLRFDYFSDRGLFHASPKLGAMYKIGNCSVRASYAGGFRAPTLKEMYMSFNMANIFMIYGNPDLEPEESHNFSLSAEYMTRRYNLTVTGYYNLVDNRITTAWSEALKGQLYTNMAPLQVAGVDLNFSAAYDFGLKYRISYTYTHERIEKGQPMTSSTRPHSATVKIEYGKDWRTYGFDVALTGRLMSAVTSDVYTSLTDYTQTESQTYPGYTMWKLSIAQRIWHGIRLNAVIDNLFNYIPDYYYNNTPATIGTTLSLGLSLDLQEIFNNR